MSDIPSPEDLEFRHPENEPGTKEGLDPSGEAEQHTYCEYQLDAVPGGGQVEPRASYWHWCPTLRTVEREEVRQALLNKIPSYPPCGSSQSEAELDQLEELYKRRYNEGDFQATGLAPLSRFFTDPEFTSQPPVGSVLSCRRIPMPLLKNGAELATLFEAETPGLWHRHVLNVLLDPGMPLGMKLSPPRQALLWAVLDVAISSALMAAWHYKWIAPGLVRVARRQRPKEARKDLNVLFDFQVMRLANGDIWREVPKPFFDQSPGTPRHPAYPSGHSTYSQAASTVMAYLLPDYADDWQLLADNIGHARLWGGVHWLTDHTFGQQVGRAVGELIIDQLNRSNVDPCIENFESPPSRQFLYDEGVRHQSPCGEARYNWRKPVCPKDDSGNRQNLPVGQ